MPVLFDNHNHSQFSFDGLRTCVEASSRYALESGLAGLCFTDHCDLYVPPAKAAHEKLVPETFDINAQQTEIERVSSLPEFTGIKILTGIELGIQKSQREGLRKVVQENKFDCIIASLHYLDDNDPFWGGYYEGKDWRTAYGHYLETILEEITWLDGDFDILGHYDYVARYAPYPEESILFKDFPELLDAILSFLAKNGKALEINTKTYQNYGTRRPVADANILKRFRELGGEYISLGSDSHDASRVGHNFKEFRDFILQSGFLGTVHFENRQAIVM